MADVRNHSGPTDEAEQDDPPVSDFEFNIVSIRLATQLDRVDKVDTKIGTVLAAIIAIIGFTATTDKSLLDYVTSCIYLVPLGFAVFAYRAQAWDDAPDPRYFSDNFRGRFPEATRRTAVEGMLNAYDKNKQGLSDKAKYTNIALFLAVVNTVVLLAVRLGEVYCMTRSAV